MKRLPASLPAPDLVKTAEPNTSKEPGAEGTPVAPEGGSGLHQLEKGLLHCILGRIAIPQHRVGKRVEPIGEKLIEILERCGRESPHPVRECVQLWVSPITRDGSSWVSSISLGIGVDGSHMNVISYSVRETVDGTVEDPIVRAGLRQLVEGTFDRSFQSLVRGPGIRRLLRRTLYRTVRLDNGAIRGSLGGNRYALDDFTVCAHTRIRHANPCGHLIGHTARVGDAGSNELLIGHPARVGDAGSNELLIRPQARIAEAVDDGVCHPAGIWDAPPIDDLVCRQTRNREASSIRNLVRNPDVVGNTARGRRFGPWAVTSAGMGLAPALPELHTLLLSGGRQLLLSKEAPASPQDGASIRPITVVDFGHNVRMNPRTLRVIGSCQTPEQRGEQGDADADDNGSLHTDFLSSPNKTP